MAIENSVSNDFLSTFVDSINIFNCRLSSVITLCYFSLADKWFYAAGGRLYTAGHRRNTVFLKKTIVNNLYIASEVKHHLNIISESEYDKKRYHNHTLQTNPWHREVEPQDVYSNETSIFLKRTINL